MGEKDGAAAAVAAMPVGPGVSPRASHRSGRDTLVSSGWCHRAKAAAFRREFELLPLPVGSLPNVGDLPLRSTSITPASSLVRGSPPLSGALVLFSLAGSPLAALFPSRLPARFSSSVREPNVKSSLLYTGHRMASW